MYARVTTGLVSPAASAAMQDMRRAGTPPPPDPITQLPGFRGNFSLFDAQTGKGMIIGLWETEAALQASMDAHQAAHREGVTAGTWLAPPTIEVFEVVMRTDPPQ